MDRFGVVGTAATCLLLVAATASPASAQQMPITFDARGGIGVPLGDFGEVAEDVGPAFNVGTSFGLSDRFFVRLDGGAQLYQGFDVGEPFGNEGVNELRLREFHVHAGASYYLVPRDEGRLYVGLNGMGGITNLNVPRLFTSVGADAVEVDISEVYPSFGGGASVGYAVARQVDVFLDAGAHVALGDEEDTRDLLDVYNDRNPNEQIDTLDSYVSVPVALGVRLTF